MSASFRLALALPLLLTACATPKPLALSFAPNARSFVGSVQWRRDKTAAPIHADFVARGQVAADQPQLFALNVAKAPGLTFLELRIGDDRWQILLPSENRTLGGTDSRAPAPLAIWLQTRRLTEELVRPADSRAFQHLPYRSGGRLYELTMTEFSVLDGRRVPTRFRWEDPTTGALLELKVHEIH